MHMTPGQVIGRYHRLQKLGVDFARPAGHVRRATGAAAPGFRRVAAPSALSPQPSALSPQPSAAPVGASPAAVKPPVAVVTTAAPPPAPPGRARFETCCWPIGDPRKRDFRFCDGGVAPGLPYCEEHALKAYVSLRRPPEDEAA
jgi:GcrA cell cycle regulator